MNIKKKKFEDLLGKKIMFFDGGMGTMLQEAGLAGGEIPETWNFEKPDIIINIHKAYLESGADIIETNAFGAHPAKLEGSGLSAYDLTFEAVKLAKQAIDEFMANENVIRPFYPFVACGLGPSAHLLEPLGTLTFDEAYEGFSVQVSAAVDAGADLILLETMTDTYEMKAAILAAKENSNLPIIASCMVNENGKLLTGGTIDSIITLLEGLRVSAIGLNCGFGPDKLAPFAIEMLEKTTLPVMLNSNAGMPTEKGGITSWGLEPKEFAKEVCQIAKKGLALIGGCCGTTPAHIKALREEYFTEKITLLSPEVETLPKVSSASKVVTLDNSPLLIGEKINPSGNKALRKALMENDTTFLLQLAKNQGKIAPVIDVNMGMPELVEEDVLFEKVKLIQGAVQNPLMIDTANTAAMEKALRYYNGKAFVNSVSGKQASMDRIFPIVEKYGGLMIALTLDDSGIPKTAEERVEVAENIVKEGAKYGFTKSDFVIDPLTLTVSSDANAPAVTIEAIKMLSEMGYKTSIGVSNVSFGLPAREHLTATFFAICMENGLSCGIINPFSQSLLSSYYSFLALRDMDKDCEKYIDFFKNFTSANNNISIEGKSKDDAFLDVASSTISSNYNLSLTIIDGLRDLAGKQAKSLLENNDPIEIINKYIVPALTKVGEAFERGDIFLPQLLASADAAQSAFTVLKEVIPASENTTKGSVLLATVKGDIHDIGKNIVKVLLENYGYNIVDLGKDVPPEKIIEVVEKKNIKLVGLSALMTTTVPYMTETIKLAKEKKLCCKFAVGGAVLTQAYADSIGADAYCKDAMATVRYADKLFSK